MKNLPVLFVMGLLLFACPVYSQITDSTPTTEELKQSYSARLKSGQIMKYAGIGLIVGGVVIAGGGIVMNAATDWNVAFNGSSNVPNSGNNDQETEIVKGILGVVGTTIGIELIAGGVVLHIIGKNKMQKYQEKLKGLSFNLKCSPQQQGFLLTYKF